MFCQGTAVALLRRIKSMVPTQPALVGEELLRPLATSLSVACRVVPNTTAMRRCEGLGNLCIIEQDACKMRRSARISPACMLRRRLDIRNLPGVCTDALQKHLGRDENGFPFCVKPGRQSSPLAALSVMMQVAAGFGSSATTLESFPNEVSHTSKITQHHAKVLSSENGHFLLHLNISQCGLTIQNIGCKDMLLFKSSWVLGVAEARK
jgi:hypothetical protein